jgi:hypothetical protein
MRSGTVPHEYALNEITGKAVQGSFGYLLPHSCIRRRTTITVWTLALFQVVADRNEILNGSLMPLVTTIARAWPPIFPLYLFMEVVYHVSAFSRIAWLCDST